MAFCLPKAHASAFLAALKSGAIEPEKLMGMESAARREYFSSIIGKDNAEGVNALFESKMLLKDQKRGLISWAKKVAGLSEPARLDFISKVQKLERVLEPAQEREFLADLAAQKLGMTVTPAEAKAISQGAKTVSNFKKDFNPATQQWSSEDARLKYGAAFVAYQDHVGNLLREANKPTFKEWIRNPGRVALDLAASTKGIVASLDNSFYGRQGIKMLFTHPSVWADAFVKSWSDIAKTIAGGDPMAAIKADVLSRPDAMNGKYKNMKVAVGLDFEEAFPTSLPEKIPIFGRVYKASEAAFNGGALRMRADLADKMIRLSEQSGVDLSMPGKQAEGIGDLVNSLTGRGNIGKMSSEGINAAFFSIRFLKSNIETLTAHYGGLAIEKGAARTFVQKEAAKNLLKIVGGMATVLFTANQLWPGSVDFDPRSSNFGKIRIGNTRFDISGGMGSLITLAARLAPVRDKAGNWHMWSKSSTTGHFTDLWKGGFGARTGLDVVEDFAEGKLSPMVGMIRDYLEGETFGGKPVTVVSAIENLVTPIGLGSITDAMNTPHSAPLLAILILDSLGIGASTYSAAKPPKNPRQIWDMELTP